MQRTICPDQQHKLGHNASNKQYPGLNSVPNSKRRDTGTTGLEIVLSILAATAAIYGLFHLTEGIKSAVPDTCGDRVPGR